jgi:nitric oxide reductase NorQ protein
VKSVDTPQTGPEFVETPYVNNLIERALTYIKAGYPIHFRGPAGTGKTTLAMRLASMVGRPVILTHGNSDFVPTDLVGGLHSVRQKKMVDNFIHSVKKSETATYLNWSDGCVTEAVKNGFTLVYDEFTRSRPETNNVLLSVLEEKLLELPTYLKGDKHIDVHPDFSAIFTSNPEEYAGVFKSQDALRDRMITLDLDFFDKQTEVAITQSKSGISKENADRIVRLIRAFRETGEYQFAPTIRSCIFIAKVLQVQNTEAVKGELFFEQVCLDILVSETNRVDLRGNKRDKINKIIRDLIETHCKPEEKHENEGNIIQGIVNP